MGFPEMLVSLAGIALGGLVVLIPLAGLTIRFAVQPVLERWLEAHPRGNQDIRMLEQRLSLLEQQVEHLERENGRILEEADFRNKLRRSETAAVTAD